VSDELAEVDDVAQARAIVDRLLPELGRVTTAQLRLRLRVRRLELPPLSRRARYLAPVGSRVVLVGRG